MSKPLLITAPTSQLGIAAISAIYDLHNDAFTLLAPVDFTHSPACKHLKSVFPKLYLFEGNLADTEAVFASAEKFTGKPIWGVYLVRDHSDPDSYTAKEEKQGKDMINSSLAHHVKFLVYVSTIVGLDLERGINRPPGPFPRAPVAVSIASSETSTATPSSPSSTMSPKNNVSNSTNSFARALSVITGTATGNTTVTAAPAKVPETAKKVKNKPPTCVKAKHRIERYLNSATADSGTMAWFVIRASPLLYEELIVDGVRARGAVAVWKSFAPKPDPNDKTTNKVKEGEGVKLQLTSVEDVGWFAAQGFQHPEIWGGIFLGVSSWEGHLEQVFKLIKARTGRDLEPSWQYSRFVGILMEAMGRSALRDESRVIRWVLKGGQFGADVDLTRRLCPRLTTLEDHFERRWRGKAELEARTKHIMWTGWSA